MAHRRSCHPPLATASAAEGDETSRSGGDGLFLLDPSLALARAMKYQDDRNRLGRWRPRVQRHRIEWHQRVRLRIVRRDIAARNVIRHQAEAISPPILPVVPYGQKVDPISVLESQGANILAIDEQHPALAKDASIAIVVAVNRRVVLVVRPGRLQRE